MKNFTVIRDNKEKVGAWYWEQGGRCDGTIIKHLDTADYTLLGYEGIVAVERKKTVIEFANNITEDRFERELVRMQSISLPYIVCEFSLTQVLDFPGHDLPPKVREKVQITSKFIIKRIHEIINEHNIHFMFCDNKYGAWKFVDSLFKRVVDG
jgi:hypothetical protein